MYLVYKWSDLMMKPLGGYTLLYIYMILWSRSHHGFYCMVILRSTTGPYGRPMLEVAYGEILFSLHRGCMGVKLGKSGWGVDMMSPMLDIPGSTPVWAQRILFSGFSNYKTICIMFSKLYMYNIKQKHWWSLTSSWPDEVQRTFSTAHWFQK